MEFGECHHSYNGGAMRTADIDAIAGGYHGDAFSVLGPHLQESDRNEKSGKSPDIWEIRAFLPQAKTASVIAGGAKFPMERRHADGVFVATLKQPPNVYQLAIEDYHGGSAVIEDPYRFGPLISEFDLHLHGEGNL